MKLCIYNVTATTHFGGLETYAWELGRAMVARGHQVDIVAGEGGRARNGEVALHAFPFISRSRFPDFGTRFRKLMERLSFAKNALPFILEQNYDAIIINKPYDLPAMWLGKRRGMRSKILFRSGGTDFFALDRVFGGAVDYWVSTSNYNASQIERRFGCIVQKVPNGVDVSKFVKADANPALRREWQVPEDATLLVSVGRLVGWKGLEVILDAMADFQNVHYLIVGEGENRSKLEKKAKALGILNRVHFAGLVTHGCLPELLSECDVFVQPSIGEEAFGISVVEAMAIGLPVILSRNGGMVEIINDHISGLLCAPGNVAEWKNAIDLLVRKPDYRRQLGVEARKRVTQAFTWAANAKAVEGIFGWGAN